MRAHRRQPAPDDRFGAARGACVDRRGRVGARPRRRHRGGRAAGLGCSARSPAGCTWPGSACRAAAIDRVVRGRRAGSPWSPRCCRRMRAARIAPIAAMRDVGHPGPAADQAHRRPAAVVTARRRRSLLGLGLQRRRRRRTLRRSSAGCCSRSSASRCSTPLISRPVVACSARSFAWSVPGKLGRLNSARNPRRTAITAAALMVGIALVTGVTGDPRLGQAQHQRSSAGHQSRPQLIISGEQSGPRARHVRPGASSTRPAAARGPRWSRRSTSDMAMVDGDRDLRRGDTTRPRSLRQIFDAHATAGDIDPLGPAQMRGRATDTRQAPWLVGRLDGDVQLTRGEVRSTVHGRRHLRASQLTNSVIAAAGGGDGLRQPAADPGLHPARRRHVGVRRPAAGGDAARGQPRGVGGRPGRVHRAADDSARQAC